jgi:hypothetical protein
MPRKRIENLRRWRDGPAGAKRNDLLMRRPAPRGEKMEYKNQAIAGA